MSFNYHTSKYTPGLSPLCSYCHQYNETFRHVFWQCSAIQPLWGSLIAWCKDNVHSTVQYNELNCLLLGFDLPVLNIIMTICKYHLFLMKRFSGSLDFEHLLSRIETYRIRDWAAYRNLPYLQFPVIKKRWLPVRRAIVTKNSN